MTKFLLILLLFLFAFAGLGAGLIFRRKGLRSGCGHAPHSDQECRCEVELDASMGGQCRKE